MHLNLLIFINYSSLSLKGSTAKPPSFPDQYTAHGVILLPYAEIREPFAAYYDGVLNRSRIGKLISLILFSKLFN